MPEISMNLLKSRVPPLRRRRQLFWGMIAYLAFCALALSAICYQTARQLAAGARERAAIHRYEAAFRKTNPQDSDILAYCQRLNRRGDHTADVMESVREKVVSRADVAMMLVGIAAELPSEIRLLDFTLDSETQSVNFKLAAPILSSSGRLTEAGEWVAIWNQNPELTTELTSIQSVETMRTTFEGRPVFALRYEGKPARGGS